MESGNADFGVGVGYEMFLAKGEPGTRQILWGRMKN